MSSEKSGDQDVPGVELDVGSLAAFDRRVGVEGCLIEAARSGLEPLIHAIFSLPYEMTDEGRLAEMPEPSTELPREKPIPKEKALTKWEQYAKEKGISKKRRDRLVWDEATQEFLPRYGRNSAKSLQRDVIIPHKESMAQGEDPFTTKKQEKKDRIRKEKKKQLANIGRAAKNSAKIAPIQALDVAKKGASGKRYLPMKQLKDGISVVQKSTASAGKFDKREKNEPKPKIAGRKRKFDPVVGKSGLAGEKERQQRVLGRVLQGKQ